MAASRGGRKIIWDDGGVAGFGARLTGKHVSFILNYRATNRTERRMTIGTLGELTVESARKRAAEVKLEVRAGGDPLMALRDQRRAVMQQRITLKAAVAKWHAANIKHWRPVTASKYLGIVEKDVLPRLGDKELEKITRVEWADLLTDVGQRSRSLAALLRSVIGSFIHWCVDHELLTAANLPSAKRVAPKQGTRERVVSDGEIARIWAATEALRSRERAFARFIVLSVVRSGAASLTMLAWVSDGAIIYPGDTPGLKRTIVRLIDRAFQA